MVLRAAAIASFGSVLIKKQAVPQASKCLSAGLPNDGGTEVVRGPGHDLMARSLAFVMLDGAGGDGGRKQGLIGWQGVIRAGQARGPAEGLLAAMGVEWYCSRLRPGQGVTGG